MRVVGLTVAGKELEIAGVSGEMALSRSFELRVEAFVRDAPPATTDLLGQRYELVLRDTHEASMTVRGFVVSVERRATGTVGGGRFSLGLGSPVAPLLVGRDSRVFQEKSAVDVVKDVLDKGGVTDVEWRTSASYPPRPYIAQHRESDWDFVERLLVEEGVYYWFEHGDDATVLVLGDDSTQAADLEGGARLPFHDDTHMRATGDTVLRVKRRTAVVHDAVRLRDYNFEKPRLELDEKAGDGSREVYDFPGRFAAPADGARLAKVRLEGLRARRVVITGEASTMRLRVGQIFELTDHPVEAMNGRLLVVSIAYEASEARAGAAAAHEGLHMTWTAIPESTAYRASRSGPVTRDPAGPQTGVVVGPPGEELHADGAGRVRVQHYWDREGKRDDKASTWMRVGQFPLGGSMIVPRVGWDVLVHHHEGDIDAPYVSTHLYDGQFPVPYALPANKTRTAWQTATTPGGGSVNEIRFEDKAGSEEIFINASKDMNVVVGDNRDEKVGVDLTEDIGANVGAKIGSNHKIGVKSDQSVTIGASETLTVSGNRAVAVTGSESTTIGASRSVTAIKGVSVEAKGGRTHTIGGSMTAVGGLDVGRMTLGSFSLTVGGAWVRAAATGLSDVTAGAVAETVGGAKIHAGAAGVVTSTNGACAETVGGAYVIAAGGNAGESAGGAMAFTVGGAHLANAPKIEVEADSEISIRVGGASLTIKPGSVELKAPTILAPGAVIAKKGSKIEHN
jgi:type VI secretion system secreted protein VgrG